MKVYKHFVFRVEGRSVAIYDTSIAAGARRPCAVDGAPDDGYLGHVSLSAIMDLAISAKVGTMTEGLEYTLQSMRALSSHAFQSASPDQQRHAESVAYKLVGDANEHGLPVVIGILIAAADMIERLQRALSIPDPSDEEHEVQP